MKINKSILIRLFILILITLLYPLYKYFSTNNYVAFVDALTIEGFILVIIGLVKSLFKSGAFSSTSYIILKTFFKYQKPYEVYLEDTVSYKPFNYPLYLGLIDIALSFILSLFA